MDIEEKLDIKLELIFCDSETRSEASTILMTYGNEPHEQEPTRVRLAILKLAGPVPNIEKLTEFAEFAKGDFRDVLAWAEYPRQSKHWSAKGAEKDKLEQADLQEYQSWLNT